MKRYFSEYLRGNDIGFTLLEMIAALVLMGLLAAIFGMGLVAAMQSHEFSRANVRLAQKAQPAMARMARELMELTDIEDRSAGANPYILYHRLPDTPTASVQRFGLLFDSGSNVIRLATNYQGGLPLGSSQGDILVDGVSNLTFNYFSNNTDPNWTSGDIQLLTSIEIILDLFRPGDPTLVKQFRTIVHMRNTSNFGGATPTTRPASADDYNACFISSIKTGR